MEEAGCGADGMGSGVGNVKIADRDVAAPPPSVSEAEERRSNGRVAGSPERSLAVEHGHASSDTDNLADIDCDKGDDHEDEYEEDAGVERFRGQHQQSSTDDSPPLNAAVSGRKGKNPAARHRQQWIKLWKAFRDDQNVTVSDQEMSPSALNHLVERFFSQLVQRNGREYSVFSIRQVWSTLNCYFSELEPPETRKDLRLPDFDGARRIYEAKVRKGKVAELGHPYAAAIPTDRRISNGVSDISPSGSSACSPPSAPGHPAASSVWQAHSQEGYFGPAPSATGLNAPRTSSASPPENPTFNFPPMQSKTTHHVFPGIGMSAPQGPGEDDSQRLARHQVTMSELLKGVNLQGANIHLHFH